MRPQFAKAMEYARTIKQAVPHQRVIFTVHEMKRLGRGAAELLTIAEGLRQADIQLELLTGPLQGLYDPSGHGAALFAFFAGMAESEREYIRWRARPRRVSAAATAGVRRCSMMILSLMRGRCAPVAWPCLISLAGLVIPTGKNKGRHPSVASVYRIVTRFRLH